MAGLAAAWLCHRAGHRVKVFEAYEGRGMDAHTREWEEKGQPAWVDVPLRVMSPDAWGSVLSLSESVGVETFQVDVTVSCSWLNRQTWLRSERWRWAGFDTLGIGSWRYAHFKTLRIVRGLIQLRNFTREIHLAADSGETLQQMLRRFDLDPFFVRGLVLPLLSTICTCREEHLLAWPGRPLLILLDTIMHRRPLVRLKGGTRGLVRALTEGMSFYSGSPVTEVRHEAEGVRVRNARGDGGLYDRVLIATQANQTQFLEPSQFVREKAVLDSFTFDHGELFVHSDESLMPARKQDWVALNYMMDKRMENSMFTVWVNAVEPTIHHAAPIFQTWNPLHAIDPAHVLARVPLQRAVVSPASVRALGDLRRLHAEPGRRVFFCGSWASPGVPLLESAVRSAMEVAARLKVEMPAGLSREAAAGKAYSSYTPSLEALH